MGVKNCNIILTGIARSGTTLVCHLLNKLPDTVALNEPKLNLFRPMIDLKNQEVVYNQIDRFFEDSRKSLIAYGTARSMQIGGRIPDNPAEDRKFSLSRLLFNSFLGRHFGKYDKVGLRLIRVSEGIITVKKSLSKDFLLCIKHNPSFSAILEILYCHYPCYAIVRNPLSILASWNSVGIPARKGRSPDAERIDHDLARKLSQNDDRFERQICLLSWWFEKYHRILPLENILRYEDVIATNGTCLKVIIPHALELYETLENKNMNKLYNPKIIKALGERLLKTDGSFWNFYSKESVELMVREIDG